MAPAAKIRAPVLLCVFADFTVTAIWWVASPHTFYRLVQLKALYLIPKFSQYWKDKEQLFFTDWCYAVYYLFVLAVTFGKLQLVEATIGASAGLALASLAFSNSYSCTSYDQFSSAQLHLMPPLGAYAMQFRTTLTSPCDLAQRFASARTAGFFARASAGPSALLPVTYCYFAWLLLWVLVVFFWRGGAAKRGLPNLYGLVFNDMGLGAALPPALVPYGPAVFCAVHVVLIMATACITLLGRWVQSTVLAVAVGSALARGFADARAAIFSDARAAMVAEATGNADSGAKKQS